MWTNPRINSGYIRRQNQLASQQCMVENPPYTVKDFLRWFPNFELQQGILDHKIIQQFITVANNNINIGRFGENWEFCIGLFTAHFLMKYLQLSGIDPINPTPLTVAGKTGIVASKKVGDASISYSNTIQDQMASWGDLGSTPYGMQFITIAEFATFPMMVI